MIHPGGWRELWFPLSGYFQFFHSFFSPGAIDVPGFDNNIYLFVLLLHLLNCCFHYFLVVMHLE